jgi:hypothetical protein
MAKKELIDSGKGGRYVTRTSSGRFVQGKASDSLSSTVKETSKNSGSYRTAVSGRFVTSKHGKSSPSSVVREYSMPNGDKITSVRRDIVDRAISRKEK